MNLVELGLYFALLSLVSVGGLPSVMPEMQRYVVDVKGWLTPSDFIQAFAVGQAAPGPNVLIASLIGWKVAVLPGAFVALGSICFPAGSKFCAIPRVLSKARARATTSISGKIGRSSTRRFRPRRKRSPIRSKRRIVGSSSCRRPMRNRCTSAA